MESVSRARVLSKDEADLLDDRIAYLDAEKHLLARDFLDYYASEARQDGLTVLAAFDRWAADYEVEDRPLLPVERGILLHAITHTPQGKRRILLAGGGKPDRFTGAREECVWNGPTDEQLARMQEGGDLARREGEGGPEYLERLCDAFGFRYRHLPAALAMPDVPPMENPAAEVRLPYKDPEDDLSDVAPLEEDTSWLDAGEANDEASK